VVIARTNSKEKIPDHLVGFCKCSSINWMAAGSRLPRSSHGIYLFSNFSQSLAGGTRAATDAGVPIKSLKCYGW